MDEVWYFEEVLAHDENEWRGLSRKYMRAGLGEGYKGATTSEMDQ